MLLRYHSSGQKFGILRKDMANQCILQTSTMSTWFTPISSQKISFFAKTPIRRLRTIERFRPQQPDPAGLLTSAKCCSIRRFVLSISVRPRFNKNITRRSYRHAITARPRSSSVSAGHIPATCGALAVFSSNSLLVMRSSRLMITLSIWR